MTHEIPKDLRVGYWAGTRDEYFYYKKASSLEEAAQKFLDSLDNWGVERSKIVTIYAWKVDSTSISEFKKFYGVIDPKEPPCVKGEHDWHPVDRVEHHAHGVVLREYCSKCGLVCAEDTGMLDPETGRHFSGLWYEKE